MKKYQVAIIGTNIGAKHFEDFQKVSDRFSVHTLCGLTRDAIDKILASNNDTKMSLNFDDVLKENRDLIIKSVQDDIMIRMIKTYSNETDTILDMTCCDKNLGDISTKLNRKYIGIDISDEFL